MKRLLACVSLVAATTTAAMSAPTAAVKPTAKSTPAPKAPPIRVAPADEYFGKLKLSVLGIRNTIKDVGANIEIDQTRWTEQASKAFFAEDATRDWEHKYPQDTWLAKTLFALERMYAKLDTDEGRKRSLLTMRWLVHDFPASWYGKTGKRELATGKVGQPLAPAVAASPAPLPSGGEVAAPAPFASPLAGAAGNEGATSSIAPSEQTTGPNGATPVPNPLPSMSPSTQNQP